MPGIKQIMLALTFMLVSVIACAQADPIIGHWTTIECCAADLTITKDENIYVVELGGGRGTFSGAQANNQINLGYGGTLSYLSGSDEIVYGGMKYRRKGN
jgi:hypothetical protein